MIEYLNDLKNIIRKTITELYEEDQSLDDIDNTLSDADKKQLEEKQKQEELKQKRDEEEAIRKEKEEKRLADIESKRLADIEKQNQIKAEKEEKRLADIEKQNQIKAEKEEKRLADIEKQNQIEDEDNKPLEDIDDKSLSNIDNGKSLDEIESNISGKEVTVPKETKPNKNINYFNLSDYRQKIKDLGKPANMKVGYYYTFDYYFDKSKDDIEFSDTMPLCLIYDSDTTKDGKKVFWGFNFHTCDVETRNKILGEPTDPLHGDNVYPRSKANWDNMVNIFPDIKNMVRQYRLDRIKNIRVLSPNVMRELAQYKAPTYYRKSYNDVVNNFKNSD